MFIEEEVTLQVAAVAKKYKQMLQVGGVNIMKSSLDLIISKVMLMESVMLKVVL